MKLTVCIILSLLISVLNWFYLVSYDIRQNGVIYALKKKKKVNIYCILTFVALCALSVVFELLYKSNTIITDMKSLVLLGILAVAFVTDMRANIIPNFILVVGFVIRLGFSVAELITLGSDYWDILKSDLLAVIVIGIMFAICALIVRNGIGMGDVKTVLVMCLYQGFYNVISSLFFSLLVAFVMAIVMLVAKKKGRKDSMAFAPALLAGTFISVFLSGC